MSDRALFIAVFLIAWAMGSAIMAGVMREIEGKYRKDDLAVATIIFWPIFCAVAAGIGLAWCATWLGRVPTKVIRHTIRQRRHIRREQKTQVRADSDR